MRRLAQVVPLLAACLVIQVAARAETPVDLELALAVDVSRSIDADEARLQRDGYVAAFRDPRVIGAIRSGVFGRIAVAYFEWAGTGRAELVIGWTLIDGPGSAHAFADALDRKFLGSARYTSISGAIDYALPLFDNGFDGTRRVIDVSGDGPNNRGRLVTLARDAAVAAGIIINGLPILDEGGGPFSRYNIPDLDLYYRDCVIGGPGAFLVVAENFTDFARAIRRKLILEIAAPALPRSPRILLAQASPKPRIAPPCDIGEQLLRGIDDF